MSEERNVIENFDTEEFDDFAVNEEVTYLICALGHDENDRVTDCEICLKEFNFPDEAIAFAKTVDLAMLLQYAVEQNADISETTYFNLEVETVVAYEDSNGSTENIDTIWEKHINIG